MDETELGAVFRTACYMDGCDREGHSVCYNMSVVFQDEEVYKKAFGSSGYGERRKKFLRWRVQVMEKGIQKLDLKPSGVLNLLQFINLKDSVGPSKELRDTMKQALHILHDNYPEFVLKNACRGGIVEPFAWDNIEYLRKLCIGKVARCMSTIAAFLLNE